MNAQYVFRVRLRLESEQPDVHLEPSTAEPTVSVFFDAAEPGTDGWKFFRETLWRGELSDEAYGRTLLEEWLDEPVESASFRELQVDEAYFQALKDEISADLEAFNADDVSSVLSKYFGSSIRVLE